MVREPGRTKALRDAPAIVVSRCVRSHTSMPWNDPMRTDIEIDDALMAESRKASGYTTMKQTVEQAPRLLIRLRRQREVDAAFGKYRRRGNLARSRKGHVTQVIAADRGIWIDFPDGRNTAHVRRLQHSSDGRWRLTCSRQVRSAWTKLPFWRLEPPPGFPSQRLGRSVRVRFRGKADALRSVGGFPALTRSGH